MATNPKANIVNPEDELFWRKVRDAYDQVNLNNEQTVTVASSNKEAEVYFSDHESNPAICVTIIEIEPDPPVLVMP